LPEVEKQFILLRKMQRARKVVEYSSINSIGIFSVMMLRKATAEEVPQIWEILQQAIAQRKKDRSEQWQNGYPNEQVVRDDINNGYAYVLEEAGNIIAYAAIIFDVEPPYTAIEGNWITDGDYAVIHRVATANAVKGRGVATNLFIMIEDLCRAQAVYSIKVDTNFDNVPMLKLVDRLGYTYCGEVYFNGAARRAFEKVLSR
jgi:GNAT superfamily N-acetyltransferase